MNIPEYYQYAAESLENGETVCGNYVHQTDFYGSPIDKHFITLINSTDIEGYTEHIEVKPETIRRVAVKQIITIDTEGYSHYYCKNCKIENMNPCAHFDYCPDCGMFVDWNKE